MSGPGRRIRLTGVVVAALLVAACSGGEPSAAPPPPPSASPSPVTTTSPAPVAPTLPAKARQNTKSGAVAFAHHYIDLVNFATTTGDSKELLRASTASCGACTEISRFVAAVYRRDGYIRGGQWVARSYSVIRTGPGHWLVAIEVEAGKQTYRSSDASPVRNRTGGKYTVSIHTERRAPGWRTRKLVSAR